MQTQTELDAAKKQAEFVGNLTDKQREKIADAKIAQYVSEQKRLQAAAAAKKAESDGIARGEGRYQNGEYGRNRTEQLVNEAQETARRESVIKWSQGEHQKFEDKYNNYNDFQKFAFDSGAKVYEFGMGTINWLGDASQELGHDVTDILFGPRQLNAIENEIAFGGDLPLISGGLNGSFTIDSAGSITFAAGAHASVTTNIGFNVYAEAIQAKGLNLSSKDLGAGTSVSVSEEISLLEFTKTKKARPVDFYFGNEDGQVLNHDQFWDSGEVQNIGSFDGKYVGVSIGFKDNFSIKDTKLGKYLERHIERRLESSKMGVGLGFNASVEVNPNNLNGTFDLGILGRLIYTTQNFFYNGN